MLPGPTVFAESSLQLSPVASLSKPLYIDRVAAGRALPPRQGVFSVPNAPKLNSTSRSRFSRGQQLILVILLLGAVYAFNTFTRNSSNPPPLASTTIVPVSTPNAGAGGDVVASNPSGALPTNANKPQPPPSIYQGCPATGDGGDPQLNTRKNRIDSAPWYPVAISSILSLNWPKSIEQKPRASWSSSDAAQVAQYEGIPVQIEGWLAGAKQQGPELCNCHSANDTDNHLWVVDSPRQDPRRNPWWPRSRLACAPSIPAGPSLVYKNS